jgi:hypothetical protein
MGLYLHFQGKYDFTKLGWTKSTDSKYLKYGLQCLSLLNRYDADMEKIKYHFIANLRQFDRPPYINLMASKHAYQVAGEFFKFWENLDANIEREKEQCIGQTRENIIRLAINNAISLDTVAALAKYQPIALLDIDPFEKEIKHINRYILLAGSKK